MNSYAEDAERFQATECYDGECYDGECYDGSGDYNEDSVCDYYDYDPYDMEIIE